MPCEGNAETDLSLILVLNPTHYRDEWVVLVVGLVHRQHAISVACHVVDAHVREAWTAHVGRLLRHLPPATPSDTPMHILCDQGLGNWDNRAQTWAGIPFCAIRPTPPSGRLALNLFPGSGTDSYLRMSKPTLNRVRSRFTAACGHPACHAHKDAADGSERGPSDGLGWRRV